MNQLENVRIGPAGWQYDDWAGTFYPARKPQGFDALTFVASYFRFVEINSTFYRIPARSTSRSWVERTSGKPDFTFTAKAFQGLTHRKSALDDAEVLACRRAMEPLHESGRLGALLLQFPWSFHDTPATRRRIQHLQDAMSPLPLALEVRHGSWMRPGGRSFLESTGLTICAIDQPVIGDSIRPGEHVAGSAGTYIRFHGRNYKHWFAGTSARNDRYDYLYSRDELEPWMRLIQRASQRGGPVHVVMNNHFRGQAPANGFELMAMLGDTPVPAPDVLRQQYPRLKEVTVRGVDESTGSGWLFDSM